MRDGKKLTAILPPDPKTARIYDDYRRVAAVFERAKAVMTPRRRYEVTQAPTGVVDLRNAESGKTGKT
jgi:hypothetical protein